MSGITLLRGEELKMQLNDIVVPSTDEKQLVNEIPFFTNESMFGVLAVFCELKMWPALAPSITKKIIFGFITYFFINSILSIILNL